ncbi:MAG: bifunctional glutamine synthetase adenylyltransferase/deadenyltransferase, partial [Gammaproteobacteria bacterium]
MDLLSQFPESVQQRLEREWQDFEQRLSDDEWVKSHLVDHKQDLFRVWGLSEFVTKQCVSQPALLVDLINSNDLFRRYPDGYFTHTLRHQLAHINSEAELQQCLRRFRNREMVRIAWRDICGQ